MHWNICGISSANPGRPRGVSVALMVTRMKLTGSPARCSFLVTAAFELARGR